MALSLQQRIAQHEERVAKLNARTRKEDTRKKVLAGAVVLAEIEADAVLRQQFSAILDRRLTRPDDRALFDGLLPAPVAANGNLPPAR